MASLVRMRYIARDGEHEINDVVSVTRAEAGLMEARAVAVRVRKTHATNKPITAGHTVTKDEV